jgi:hypothetical protein
MQDWKVMPASMDRMSVVFISFVVLKILNCFDLSFSPLERGKGVCDKHPRK